MLKRIRDRAITGSKDAEMPAHAKRTGTRAWSRGVALLIVIVLAALLTACGGSGSSDPQSAAVSGNWQFTFSPPTTDGSFVGGVQSGFLLQSGNSVTGAVIYAISVPNSQTGPCNSGVATVSGTLSGQNVTLTIAAGSQTFTLAGQLSSSGLSGTYTSTAGTASDGSACGSAISSPGLSWSAISIPALTGSIQGSFHSTEPSGSGLSNEDFLVSGVLSQSPNIGATNATVSGSLTFTSYPCLSTVAVNGQISGSSVILQLIATNGATVGQIGGSLGSSTGVSPVSFDSAQGGYILHGDPTIGPAYMVASSGCSGTLVNTTDAGDYGNLCLSLNSTSPCQQPITLTPASLTFPAQFLGSASTSQTVTLTNNSASALSGLTFGRFPPGSDSPFNYGGQNFYTDFNGIPSFSETDACGPGGSAAGSNPFDLDPGQACSITITFLPQEACPWLPYPNGTSGPSLAGASPEYCPFAQTTSLSVMLGSGSSSADGDTSFSAAISGTGLSAIQPSTPELDFGAENAANPAEASLPQLVTFTNYSTETIQILGSQSCTNPPKGKTLTFPHDPTRGVAGLQVVPNNNATFSSIAADNATIFYDCDVDPGTFLPNFQISSDTCTGATMSPQASCSIEVSFVPQPNTDIAGGLDFFLQLNTVQCYGGITTNCEIDSGRFPVELRANGIGPLRMTPSAGLDFGTVPKGTTSAPMTVTLLNDPNLPDPQSVAFQGRFAISGNYLESDDCPAVLEVGGSCTLSLTFTPTGTGLETGKVQIFYASQLNNPGAVIYLRGIGH
jgi:hypothetical protein